MKRGTTLLLTMLLALGLMVATTFGTGAPIGLPSADSMALSQKPQYIEGEVLVKYQTDSQASDHRSLRAAYQLSLKEALPFIDTELLATPKGQSTMQIVAKLAADPRVAAVQPNYLYHANELADPSLPSDPAFNLQWALHNTGQVINGVAGQADVDLDAPEAWQSGSAPASPVVVAVIDTGVDINHPDLKGKIWVNKTELNGIKGTDDDKNGYIDDINGWNFVNNSGQVYINASDDYHGTHVAGSIAAGINDGTGIAGVANQVSVMPLKFLGPGGTGSTVNAVKAIQYATSQGALLANNSWGGGSYDPALYAAIREFSRPFIVAAGNEKKNTDLRPSYPSAYDLANIIAVAAIDNRGIKAAWSNYGLTTVDVGAPGVNIYSCYPGGMYTYLSGTSMAAPHVSGVVALVLGAKPAFATDRIEDVAAVKKIILDSARANPLISLAGKTVTGGTVNARDALLLANGNTLPTPPDVTPPVLISVTPSNKSRNIPLQPDVTFYFDDVLQNVTESGISFVYDKTQPVDFTATVSGSALIIRPTAALPALKICKVTVAAGSVANTDGISTTSNYSTSFTTTATTTAQ